METLPMTPMAPTYHCSRLFQPVKFVHHWGQDSKTGGGIYPLSIIPSYCVHLLPLTWDIHSTFKEESTSKGTKFCRWNNNGGACKFDGRPWVWWQDGGWMQLPLSMACSWEGSLEALLLLLISGVQCMVAVLCESQASRIGVVHPFLLDRWRFVVCKQMVVVSMNWNHIFRSDWGCRIAGFCTGIALDRNNSYPPLTLLLLSTSNYSCNERGLGLTYPSWATFSWPFGWMRALSTWERWLEWSRHQVVGYTIPFGVDKRTSGMMPKPPSEFQNCPSHVVLQVIK